MSTQQHPNGVRTRPATTSDQTRVFELVEELTGEKENSQWEDVYLSHLRGERGAIIVAENDDGILGVATVSYNLTIRYGGEYCELEELIVDDSARGLNLGRILVQRTIDEAKERGCLEIGLYLVPSTEGNRGFYEKLGFEVIGTEMRQTL
ncbi:MAG: GNAT family N-acetyltransferase [Actinomycetota bacterium]|nr:GNAT family N-acetyltransferase [Actinomycetota bacterium]MED5292892.1 GNAT family N-acetyltransferase [Actinomycetota bacterium]